MAPRKPSRGRTPQQRRRAAAARQDAEREELRRLEADGGTDDSGGTPWYRRIVTRRRAEPEAPRDITPTAWSQRGMLTLMLIIAVLQIPLAIAYYLGDRTYSLATYLVITLYASPFLIPTPFVVTLLAMPLARALAGEKRSLRFLESLGVGAVLEISLLITWSAVPKSLASYHDANVVLGALMADVGALLATAFLYPVVSRYLSPQRRMRK
jgi:hypothetical protein